jgi:hypothetical protein
VLNRHRWRFSGGGAAATVVATVVPMLPSTGVAVAVKAAWRRR